MSLTTCPECNHEVSDQSLSCPHCGYPLLQNNSNISLSEVSSQNSTKPTTRATITEEPQTLSNLLSEKKNKIIKWTVICTAVILFLIVFFTIFDGDKKVSKNNLNFDSLYNKELGTGVKLGQNKVEVDKALGEPSVEFENYVYNGALYTTYADGKLKSIYVEYPNDQWITKSDVKIGTTVDELKTLYGKPSSIEHDNKWWYYNEKSYIAGFEISDNNEIKSIYIYYPEKEKN